MGKQPDARLIDFVLPGVAWGLFGGLLEGVVRTWLQSVGATNFDARLTAVSPRIIWVAPVSYVLLFTAVSIAIALGRLALGRVRWEHVTMVAVGMLAWLGPIAASGRVANVSAVLLALGLSVATNRLISADVLARRKALVQATTMLAVLAGASLVAVEVAERQLSTRPPLAAAGTSQPANVILIIVDSLRADRLQNYGYARAQSPALIKIASEGVLFAHAIAASSWSLPSHVSLLTGRYPTEHGAEIDRYDGRLPMISQAFQDKGYRTGAISANTLVFSRAFGFDAGFEHFTDSFYSPLDGFTRTILGKQVHKAVAHALGWRYHPVKLNAEAVTHAAARWIAAEPGVPFFLALNYFDVHDPGAPIPPVNGNGYDGAVTYVDRWVGELVSSLDSRGLGDDTVVMVTSDHGQSHGEHNLKAHGSSLYIEQIHVPLIVRAPTRVPAGRRIDVPVSLISVPATLLQLGLGATQDSFRGPSLVPLWSDAAGSPEWPPPISELRYRPWHRSREGQDALQSVVEHPWHYIRHTKGANELFHLEQDRAETNNLARDAAHKDVVGRLEHTLNGMATLSSKSSE